MWFKKKATLRIPQVGDVVWWAPKQEECVVKSVDASKTVFVGGPTIQRKKDGRAGPRWTVMAATTDMNYDDSLKCWIVGSGPTPRLVDGILIKPQPVVARVGDL